MTSLPCVNVLGRFEKKRFMQEVTAKFLKFALLSYFGKFGIRVDTRGALSER